MTRKPKNKIKNVDKKTPMVSKLLRVLGWLASTTGAVTVIATLSYKFVVGTVDFEFIKESGRGYELKLINNSPVERTINSFRIVPDFKQQVVFKITKGVYAEETKDGVILPGGNITSIPAYEFKEIDGYDLSADDSLIFKAPPLSSRDYLSPEAMLIYVKYKTTPKNKLFSSIESVLTKFGFHDSENLKPYIVSSNYWNPVSQTKDVDVMKIACRDDDQFNNSGSCRDYQKLTNN
jgi:hypothetical protein